MKKARSDVTKLKMCLKMNEKNTHFCSFILNFDSLIICKVIKKNG